MTHSLVSIDIQREIYIDGVGITPRGARDQAFLLRPISQVMQS